jgi:F-type H+-transporting ATPase subunit epsilon
MAETLIFELVTPARLVLSQPVEMVVVPGAEGDFAAMPRHAPLISSVRPGVIDVYLGGKITARIFVAGGFAEVTGERCTVLAEEAIAVDDLDTAAVDAHFAFAKRLVDTASEATEFDAHKQAGSQESSAQAERSMARTYAQAERATAVAQAMRAALEGRAAN